MPRTHRMTHRIQYRSLSERKDMQELVRLIRTELIPMSYSVDANDASVIRTLPERFREGRTVVAASGKHNAPVGFVHFDCLQSILHIDMLVVNPGYRNSKIGQKLMERAEIAARAQGCMLAMLYVDDGNEKARRFYERIGYTPVRHFDSYKVTQFIKPL